MKETIQERAIKAAATFVTHRGYEVIETDWSPEEGIGIDVVALDEDCLVFIDVTSRESINKGLPEECPAGSRQRMEIAAAKWLSKHLDDERFCGISIRFDMIAMMVLGSNRALLRHHINAIGRGDFADTAD